MSDTLTTLPTAILKPGEADRLIAGHPWVFQSSISRYTQPPADGDVVQVKDHRQRLIGIGFYNSKSKISVRLLAPERVDINEAFFIQRIEEALAVRQRHMPGATSFRLINAESDGLSGLIVDKYADVLVVQMSSFGMDLRKAMITEALKKVMNPRAILERNDIGSRKFEGLEECSSTLFGSVDGPVTIDLGGVQMPLDLSGGHKTGYYLDQQINYQLVGKLAKDANVLDCFCFLGGFSLHAAKGGAAHVHGLDQSEDAVKRATENAKLNNVGERCSFETANVFDWLKARTNVGANERLIPPSDLVVLDPPSFTRNRASVPDALRGYKEIHLRALKLLKRGGTLATFCCSHHVDANLYEQTIMDAAVDAKRQLRRVATYWQSPDHPILPAIAETLYLKGFAYELVN